MATWTTPLVFLSVCLYMEKKKEKERKNMFCFSRHGWFLNHEVCPVLDSIPFRCTCWTLTIILWWLIHYPSIHPDSKSEWILLLHAQEHRNVLVCVWHISHPCVVKNLVVGSPECVIFPFLYVCVRAYVHEKKKKYIKCFQTSLYSDALLSSCSRRRQQRTKCTPTCIISAASPLVTSPFPQALSSLTALSKIVS